MFVCLFVYLFVYFSLICVSVFFSVSVSFVLFSESWQVLANAMVDDEVMSYTIYAC